jgi:hypothetical protein
MRGDYDNIDIIYDLLLDRAGQLQIQLSWSAGGQAANLYSRYWSPKIASNIELILLLS